MICVLILKISFCVKISYMHERKISGKKGVILLFSVLFAHKTGSEIRRGFFVFNISARFNKIAMVYGQKIVNF